MTDETNVEAPVAESAPANQPEAPAPKLQRKRKPKAAYTRAVADEICERLADGESLNQICRDDNMPSAKDVRRWTLEDIDGFRERYKAARDLLIDYWSDEIIDNADDATNDYMERIRENGDTITVVDHENIARSRLRVDARKWLLSKLRPDQYGERMKLDADVTTRTHEERQAELDRLEAAALGVGTAAARVENAGGEDA